MHALQEKQSILTTNGISTTTCQKPSGEQTICPEQHDGAITAVLCLWWGLLLWNKVSHAKSHSVCEMSWSARQHNAHDPRECKAKHIPLYGRAACILCFLPKAVKMDDGLIRESQTADMYRFLGHYDRPYTPGSVPGGCLTSHAYRYNPVQSWYIFCQSLTN